MTCLLKVDAVWHVTLKTNLFNFFLSYAKSKENQ